MWYLFVMHMSLFSRTSLAKVVGDMLKMGQGISKAPTSCTYVLVARQLGLKLVCTLRTGQRREG